MIVLRWTVRGVVAVQALVFLHGAASWIGPGLGHDAGFEIAAATSDVLGAILLLAVALTFDWKSKSRFAAGVLVELSLFAVFLLSLGKLEGEVMLVIAACAVILMVAPRVVAFSRL
jgi:hypothetical protein